MTRLGISIALIFAVTVSACGGDDSSGDKDLGPVDEIVSFSDQINWPGIEEASGRVIPFISGFGEGIATGYWFLGFASRQTADSFWFCREGDDACPLDANQQLNWDRLVGQPLFTRIPGQPNFSPFWQMWTVTVPADYEPDSIKTADTLNKQAEDGMLSVEPFILDFGSLFGEEVGFQAVILHCALVLTGTTLAEVPEELPASKTLEIRRGWHEGYQVEFVDFSTSDGVFAEADDSENRPLMRFANIYIQWRQCASDPRPAICDIPGHALDDRRPVSERGLGQDITADGDANDSNNTLGSIPCEPPLFQGDAERVAELPYSPLWGVNNVVVELDSTIALVDTHADQLLSDIMSVADMFAAVDNGIMTEPEPAEEDETGNPVEGNEGQVFFNCPNPVPVDFVPYPCSDNE